MFKKSECDQCKTYAPPMSDWLVYTVRHHRNWSFCFWNEAGNVVSLNGLLYWNMMEDFFLYHLDYMDPDGMWHLKDGVNHHTAIELFHLFEKLTEQNTLFKFQFQSGQQNNLI